MLITDTCVIKLPYDQNCLYIRVEGVSYCLDPWHMGMACSRYVDGCWRPAPDQPNWQFGDYHPNAKYYSPVARFLAPIPPELRRLAGRFTWGQIPALRLLRLTPYAAQLAATEPVLFWLMAIAFQEQRFSARECQALFLLPRKKILPKLVAESQGLYSLSVNTLHKLRLRWYDHREYYMFMCLHRNGFIHSARHAPTICLQTIMDTFRSAIFPASPFIVMTALLDKLPRHLWFEASLLFLGCLVFARGILRVNSITELTGIVQLAECVLGSIFAVYHSDMACRVLNDLRAVNNALFDQIFARGETECGAEHRYDQKPEEYPPFPTPPLAGSATIVPITTAVELHGEGVAMEHCVYSLADSVSKGSISIYRVLAPERGTLSLRIINGQPQIEEFRLHGNAEPSEESQKCVRIWISRAKAVETPAIVEEESICNTRNCA